MTSVMHIEDHLISQSLYFQEPFFKVRDYTARGATDIEKIHHDRADAGELRPTHRGRRAKFRCGYDFTNCASTQSTGSKGKGLVKTVVQFRPFTRIRQLLDYTSVIVGPLA